MGAVRWVSGTQERVDYTPSSDVVAGDVVVVGDLVGVANFDIAANRLGALSITGRYRFPKATGSSTAIPAGTKVYWDATNQVATATATGNKRCGTVTPGGGGLDADTSIEIHLIQG